MERVDRGDGEETIGDLSRRVASLEARVAGLGCGPEGSGATEDVVRTRRLVVVDDAGNERLVADADAERAVLAVRGTPDVTASVAELYVHEGVDGDASQAGLALGRGGELVAALEVDGRRRPSLWLARRPGRRRAASESPLRPGRRPARPRRAGRSPR